MITNPRHERFAQELAKGKSASEAYVLAGFKPNDGNCIRLKGNERIAARVAELQGKGAAHVVVTLESLLNEAELARELAMKLEQPAAAVAAIREKGVLAGIRVEKRENKAVKDASQYSDAELAAIIASGSSERAAGPPGSSTLTH